MKNIHYLFYITSKHIFCHLESLINLNIPVLENANSCHLIVNNKVIS